MRHLPDSRRASRTGEAVSPGAGLSPTDRRHAHARHRVLQDPGGRLVVPVRERRRRRAARPLQLPRLRAVPALPGLGPPGPHRRLEPAGRTSQELRARRPAASCSKKCWPPTAPRTCRACRASAAAPSATRATTRSATSSACRTPPPDDRGLPDLCFAFYDRMVIFDHINKTVAVVAHAHVDPSDPQQQLRRGVRARRSAGRAAAAEASPTCS